ncbi:MAG: proteasome assembly chaperone family protein [Thermofilaceae archaeon]
MKEWSFHEFKRIPRANHLIVGMPDVGLVGLIALTHIVRSLNAEIMAYIDSPHLPPVIMYHEGRPYPVMRIHHYSLDSNGYLMLVSDVLMNVRGMRSFAQMLIEWAQSKGIERVFLLGGVPTPQRMNLDKPAVYAAGVTESDIEIIEKAGVQLFKEGFVSGPYAMILKECFVRSVKGIALMAESFLNYPDPGAAAAVVSTLAPLAGLRIDVEPLLKQEEEIRVRLRETMRRTMEAMRASGKTYEYAVPAMYI